MATPSRLPISAIVPAAGGLPPPPTLLPLTARTRVVPLLRPGHCGCTVRTDLQPCSPGDLTTLSLLSSSVLGP